MSDPRHSAAGRTPGGVDRLRRAPTTASEPTAMSPRRVDSASTAERRVRCTAARKAQLRTRWITGRRPDQRRAERTLTLADERYLHQQHSTGQHRARLARLVR